MNGGGPSPFFPFEHPRCALDDPELAKLSSYAEIDALSVALMDIPGIKSLDDIEDAYCGSPMQDSLAFSQFRLNGDEYEMDFTWEVKINGQSSSSGSVDQKHLIAAWKDTVARQAALRTVFLESTWANSENSLIHQVVLRKIQPSHLILRAESAVDALKLLKDVPSLKEHGSPFDKAPPHRLLICFSAEGQAFLRLQINHMIFDTMSADILLRELSMSYSRIQNSDSTSNQELYPNRFADFVHFTRNPTTRAASLEYWSNKLYGKRPCLFPCVRDSDTSESSGFSLTNEYSTISIQSTLEFSELRRQLATHKVTVPALFQLVWALVLKVYTLEDDLVFGYLSSGRDVPIPGIENTVGPFISMLVANLDFRLNRHRSVIDTLRLVQQDINRSLKHQTSCLAEVTATLDLPNKSPLFNTCVSFTPMQREMRIPYLSFKKIATNNPTEFPLNLSIKNGEDIEASLHYRRSFISDAYAGMIVQTTKTILSRLIADQFVSLDSMLKIVDRDFQNICNRPEFQTMATKLCRREILDPAIGNVAEATVSDIKTKGNPSLVSGVKKLVKLWEKVLQVRVGEVDCNFFDLGGNSLAAMELRYEAQRAGFTLSVANIFARPVLKDMAIFLFCHTGY